MGYYDVMQVCLNGHQITAHYDGSPQFRQDYCNKCGKQTIYKCPNCNEFIRGKYISEGVLDLTSTPVPSHCHKCGAPYPWKKEKIKESEKPKINLQDYRFHSKIEEVASDRFESGQYADAVEASFKEVIKRVKDYVNNKMGGSFDGDKAMNRAFGFENQEPLIKFNALKTDEEKDEQRGLMYLFKGIVGIRNRKAHENIVLDDPYKASEYLALASLLMRLLDKHET